MSHKPLFWPGGQIRYSIDRENMRICIMYKCPNFSFGSCKLSKCTLRKKVII